MPWHYNQLITGTLSVLALIVVYFNRDELLSNVASMTKSSTTLSTPVKVILLPSTSTSSNLGSASIQITVENLSPHPISILRWSSPLDLHPAATGVFTFTSMTTNAPAPCLDMKFNHQLPTSGYFTSDDENVINIPANGKIERNVEFREPEIALMKGETYAVKTQGSWKGIWIHKTGEDDVGKLYLDDASLERGDFQSNEIIIEIREGVDVEL